MKQRDINSNKLFCLEMGEEFFDDNLQTFLFIKFKMNQLLL